MVVYSQRPGFTPPRYRCRSHPPVRCRERGAGYVLRVSGDHRDTFRRTTMTMELHHVSIVVDDLDAATAFFAELGLEPE